MFRVYDTKADLNKCKKHVIKVYKKLHKLDGAIELRNDFRLQKSDSMTAGHFHNYGYNALWGEFSFWMSTRLCNANVIYENVYSPNRQISVIEMKLKSVVLFFKLAHMK
jgi:hypothetical protein